MKVVWIIIYNLLLLELIKVKLSQQIGQIKDKIMKELDIVSMAINNVIVWKNSLWMIGKMIITQQAIQLIGQIMMVVLGV